MAISYNSRVSKRAIERKEARKQLTLRTTAAFALMLIGGTSVVSPALAASSATGSSVAGLTQTAEQKSELSTKVAGSIKSMTISPADEAMLKAHGVTDLHLDQAVVQSNAFSKKVGEDGVTRFRVVMPAATINESVAKASTPASTALTPDASRASNIYGKSYGQNITTKENIDFLRLSAGDIDPTSGDGSDGTIFGNADFGTGMEEGIAGGDAVIMANPSSSVYEGGVAGDIAGGSATKSLSKRTAYVDDHAATLARLADLSLNGTQRAHNPATLVSVLDNGKDVGFWLQYFYSGVDADGNRSDAALTDPVWVSVKSDLRAEDSHIGEANAIVGADGSKQWKAPVSEAAEKGLYLNDGETNWDRNFDNPANPIVPSALTKQNLTAGIDFTADSTAADAFSFGSTFILPAETSVTHGISWGVDENGVASPNLKGSATTFENPNGGTTVAVAADANGVNEIKNFVFTYQIADDRYGKTWDVPEDLLTGRTLTLDGRDVTLKVLENAGGYLRILVSFADVPAEFTVTSDKATVLGGANAYETAPTAIEFAPRYKWQYKTGDSATTGTPVAVADAGRSKGQTINVNLLQNDKPGAGLAAVKASVQLQDLDGKWKKVITIAGKGKIVVKDNGTADFTPDANYDGEMPKLKQRVAYAAIGSDLLNAPAANADLIFNDNSAIIAQASWMANGTLEDQLALRLPAQRIDRTATRASIKPAGANTYTLTLVGEKGNETFSTVDRAAHKIVAFKAGQKLDLAVNDYTNLTNFTEDANGVITDNNLKATVVSNTAGKMTVKVEFVGGIAGAQAKSLDLAFDAFMPGYKTSETTLSLGVDRENIPAPEAPKPVAVLDSGVSPYGTPVDLKVLANDTKSGESYEIVAGSIFLKDANGQMVKSLFIEGQGTYKVIDAENIVRFTPVDGFSGKADAVGYEWTEKDSVTGATNKAGSTAQAEILPQDSPDDSFTEEETTEDDSTTTDEAFEDSAHTGVGLIGLVASGLAGLGGVGALFGTKAFRRRKKD